MTDKLTKEQVLTLARNIPLIIEDLRVMKSKYYMRYKVRWDEFNKKGAMGYEVTKMYLDMIQLLPDNIRSKYP